jgi:uncharacterized circularly permuted ATP-grasp superfamily protein
MAVQHESCQGDLLEHYDAGTYFCELTSPGNRSYAGEILRRLNGLDATGLRRRSKDAERELLNLGITFTVYTDRDSIDRILPFDVIPRVMTTKDWRQIEAGVKQRVSAINLFLHDIYHDQKILKDRVIPEDLIVTNPHYREEMRHVKVPQGTYVHVCGTDLVRNQKGVFQVLEDNARTPSGVSYVIENRHLMMRAFPDLADGCPPSATLRQIASNLRGGF